MRKTATGPRFASHGAIWIRWRSLSLSDYSIAMSRLRKLGFCGADDSVSPLMLGLISQAYPFVEFGVLFRPDKEGQPRYATSEWVQKLGAMANASNGKMTLAAHLCGQRVNEVLSGDDTFLSTLPSLGFQRIQINATVINGCNVDLSQSVPVLYDLIRRYPNLEFIIQKNDETKPLWCSLLIQSNEDPDSHSLNVVQPIPENITLLMDESKGTGILPPFFDTVLSYCGIGYAGGIGPRNIKDVLERILETTSSQSFWIDMESSLRSVKNDQDVFDLDKCISCIEAVCDMNLHSHPSYLRLE